MNKFLVASKSRTVWTVVVLVLLNGIPAARDSIPPDFLPIVDVVLGILAAYFRVNRQADLS